MFQIPFCFTLVFGTVGASSSTVAHVSDSLHVFSSAALLDGCGPSRMVLPGALAFASTAFFVPKLLLCLSDCSFPHCPPHLLPLARFSRDWDIAVITVALLGSGVWSVYTQRPRIITKGPKWPRAEAAAQRWVSRPSVMGGEVEAGIPEVLGRRCCLSRDSRRQARCIAVGSLHRVCSNLSSPMGSWLWDIKEPLWPQVLSGEV